MATVAKGLTHRIVVPAFVGSRPISRPIYFKMSLGISQAVRQRTLTPSCIGSNPISPAIFLRTWLSGRASPCQGEGRGFDSRLPLHSVWRHSQVVRQSSAKALPQFKSGWRLHNFFFAETTICALSSADRAFDYESKN